MNKPLTSDYFRFARPPVNAARWVIAYSGGLDSTALLKLCVDYRDQHRPYLPLLALHVNHGLVPQADQWQAHCASVCESLGVPFSARKVTIRARPRRSTEQLAREARYQCFRELLETEDLLLLAHHQDDQAETMLYRLVRGSGALGLRSMVPFAESGGLLLWRPLLSVTRAELEDFVGRQGLPWIEDSSNQDQTFDRNFIRHQVMPLLAGRWPAVSHTLGRAARLAGESAQLNDTLAAMDLEPIREPVTPHRLPMAQLQSLDDLRLKNALRYWFRQQGASLPSEQIMYQILVAVRDYHSGQNTLIEWPGAPVHSGSQEAEIRWQCRTFQQALWLVQSTPEPDPGWWARLTTDSPTDLPASLGRLRLRQGGDREDGSLLNPECLSEPLTVRFRQGGERFQPVMRPAKALKKWLNEWQVPPWERRRMPLVFCGETLVWVPGRGVAEGFQLTGEKAAAGLGILWEK
ncbi:MAG: tRNA lysidine(34) synthetase TilS [Ketobacteraceae bacterium]|nr:tRNA lysidine(34) synthetase TilS [Ketobacteraceae bacterium]